MGGSDKRRRRWGATLGETVSPETASKLLKLREMLGATAKGTVTKQLEAAESYKKQRDGAALDRAGQQPKDSGAKRSPPPSKQTTAPSKDGRNNGLFKPNVTNTSAIVGANIPLAGRKKTETVKTNSPPKEPFRWWELPQQASVRELPPVSIAASDQSEFKKILQLGGEEEISQLPELFAVIGLDFGTSSTKVIVRFPYEAGQPTVAIPAPRHCLSDRNEYLWQTVLWLREDGQFIAWPEPKAHLCHSLKQGVMHPNQFSPTTFDKVHGLAVRPVDSATAYLAFVIRYVRGWLRINRPNLFRGRYARWLLNLGLPAENADKDELSRTYRQVAAAALLCANHDGPVDVDATNIFLMEEQVRAAARSSDDALQLGIGIVAETVAEAAGFAKSNLAAPDLYLLVDVGATTLDVCTFRLHNWRPGEDQYGLLSGIVRPLGVEAMHWFQKEGRHKQGFMEQCDRCLKEVVWTTKQEKDPNAQSWRPGNELSVFLVGGGARNSLHRSVVRQLAPWLTKYTGNSGIRFLDIPTPKGIECPLPLESFGRMGVAWGLSYPDDELGTILPLSKCADVPVLKPKDWLSSYISKDVS